MFFASIFSSNAEGLRCVGYKENVLARLGSYTEVFAGKVLKTEDPQGQRSEHRCRDQPIESFLDRIRRANITSAAESRLVNQPISFGCLGDSLRICEQPLTHLEKFDDAC